MSNETVREKGRVKSLATSNVKKRLIKNKWRRLCSVDKCERQSRRKGLCAEHFIKNTCQEQSNGSIGLPLADECETNDYNATNSIFLTENHTRQNTLDGYGELFFYINSIYLKIVYINYNIFRKYPNNYNANSSSYRQYCAVFCF